METAELIQIQSQFKELEKMIYELAKSKIVQPEPNRSVEIKDLCLALSKAQAEMSNAEKNKTNPFFKSGYADFASIVSASREPLTKFGLSVTQQILQQDSGEIYLITTLWHISGQWINSKVRIVPAKNDVQAISSAVTYQKRMCYSALVLQTVGEIDDDAERAVYDTRETFAKGVALNTKYNPKEEAIEVITKEQLDELNYELAEYPDICEMVLDGLKIQSLADMPKSKFLVSTKRIREIKNSRNGNK
jgi:hypothetical protein